MVSPELCMRSRLKDLLPASMPRVILSFFQYGRLPEYTVHESFCWLNRCAYFYRISPVGSSCVIGLFSLSFGAAVVSMLLEELKCLGVEWVVLLGSSGSLSCDIRLGDVFVPSGALMGDGVSSLYLPGARFVGPSESFLSCAQRTLQTSPFPLHYGNCVSMAHPYMWKRELVDLCQANAVLSVDMEAATLFAVSNALAIQSLALFAVSDVLEDETWHSCFRSSLFQKRKWELLRTACQLLVDA